MLFGIPNDESQELFSGPYVCMWGVGVVAICYESFIIYDTGAVVMVNPRKVLRIILIGHSNIY